MNTFIPTLTLMGQVKTLLTALQLSPGVALFDKVEVYSTPDLVKARRELLLFDNRLCLIIPSGNDYENKFAGKEVQTEVKREFVLLLTDRDFSKRKNAALGSGSDTPGVVKMNDLVEAALLGQNLGQSPVMLRMHPLNSEAFQLVGESEEQSTGRAAWQMTWQCSGGRMVVTEKS